MKLIIALIPFTLFVVFTFLWRVNYDKANFKPAVRYAFVAGFCLACTICITLFGR